MPHPAVNANIFLKYMVELCNYLQDVLLMSNACLISMDNARVPEIYKITSSLGLQIFMALLKIVSDHFQEHWRNL